MKTKLKIDAVLLITIIFLYLTDVTGLLLHELIGVGTLLTLILHIILNYQWFVSQTKRLTTLHLQLQLKYVLNISLALTFILIMVSGVIISQHVFAIFAISSDPLWITIHNVSSYFAIALVSLHLFVHRNFLFLWMKKRIRVLQAVNYKALGVQASSIFLLGFGLFVSIYQIKQEIIIDTNDEEVKQQTIQDSNQSEATQQTLDDYLSQRNCSGCGRHCALNAIRCHVGDSYVEAATKQFNETYTYQVTNEMM